MDRIERTEDVMKRLGASEEVLVDTFPEMAAIKDRFLYGEVWTQGVLDTRRRLLVTIACLTTVEGDDLAATLRMALGQELAPAELQEVFHQVAPYIGFAKVEKGLAVLGEVFDEQGIALPLERQGTVTEENRLERGIATQKSIFGPAIDAMRANAPAEQAFIQDALSAYCFGDTYTRGALDLATRELLTFACIISLGGCDSQARSHVAGNLAVGNGPDVLLSAATQCLPFIGFPRTLNAISAIGDVLKSQNE